MTGLANKTGAVDIAEGTQISWSSIEGPEFRILFAEAFNGNILAIVGAIVFLAMFYWLYKEMTNTEVPSKRYETITDDIKK